LRETLEEAAMSISLDSLVGELQIIAGARQSTTPATQVATAPRRAARGRAEDTLYVLADVPGASSGVLGDLIQAVLTAYWGTPGSVTSALRAAIAAGGEWLMDRNVNAPAPDRLSGSLSCAVLRGSEVVIAQAGPASAYVAQHGTVQHYPTADAEPATPLGVARANDVRFARVDLQPGDVIVLTDARWATRLPVEAVASAIVAVSVAQALTNLAQLTANGDLIALAIEAAGATDTAAATSTVAASSSTITPAAVRPAPGPIEPAARPGTAVRSEPVATPVERPVIQPKPVAPKAAPKSEPSDDVDREPPSATAKAWLGALFQGARRGAGSVGAAGQMITVSTGASPATPRARARVLASRDSPSARRMKGLG